MIFFVKAWVYSKLIQTQNKKAQSTLLKVHNIYKLRPGPDFVRAHMLIGNLDKALSSKTSYTHFTEITIPQN